MGDFLYICGMENENLIGFKRKMVEIVKDPNKVNEILNLFPENIIMPLYYKGDTAKLNDGDDIVEVTIVKSGWKNGEYIYYFHSVDGDLVYEYEDMFIME
jgi:hypothetical protein